MKRAELLKHTKCDVCHQKIGSSGLPLFWRVRVERFGVDLKAVQRQDGLGAFLGHHGIAAVMGPDEDMARQILDVTLTVCEPCAMEQLITGVAMEKARRAELGEGHG